MNTEAIVKYIETVHLHGSTERQLIVLQHLKNVLETMLDERKAIALREGILSEERYNEFAGESYNELAARWRARRLSAYGCYE